jgi:hypothetical protein
VQGFIDIAVIRVKNTEHARIMYREWTLRKTVDDTTGVELDPRCRPQEKIGSVSLVYPRLDRGIHGVVRSVNVIVRLGPAVKPLDDNI